ncbi:MAG TPA: YdeI/OmpD-associated family protein [Candidatus Limnocylindrales bacterium]
METISCGDVAEWEAWLADNHAIRDGIWVRIAKKGSGERSVTAAEAGEAALCFGWIDSHRKGLDATHFLQKYSPRRRGSSWSRVNVERVEALIAAGRMRPSGLAEVEAARADGRWAAAYASQRTATVPEDLAAALAADGEARAFFEQLPRTDRYAVILRLLKARTPAGREAQLRRMIALLHTGQRVG